MNKTTLHTNALMLLVAMIWGSAFVAQRLGMDNIGPLLFSGLRFILGALVVLPFLLYRRHSGRVQTPFLNPALIGGGILLGLIVTAGINLQQIGLLYTSVSHAGFITGMYVLIVPILGLLVGIRSNVGTWAGAILAVSGLYLLSVDEGLQIAPGDWFQLASACCWAVQVLAMGWLAKRYDPLRLAFIQFVTCALISTCAAAMLEPVDMAAIGRAAPALLYAGILSIGIAFSLQAIALQHARPTHAAIILSLEGVFAALAAAVLLGESLGGRGYLGAGLMLSAMLLAQLWPSSPSNSKNEPLPCLSSGSTSLPLPAYDTAMPAESRHPDSAKPAPAPDSAAS